MTINRRPFAFLALATASCADDPSFTPVKAGPNLRIETAYFVQATQNRPGTVPLVANRDAYLRVFVVADGPNTAVPSVRVRIYHGSTLRETLTIAAEGAGVPTAVNQGNLAGSWDARVPAALVQPGLRMEAEVDPAHEVAESDEGDNVFPAPGSSFAPRVEAIPPLRIRFVPIHQRSNGLVGRVSEANKHEFMSLSRKLLPIPSYDADVRAPFTVEGLSLDPQGNSWQGLVTELNAVRVAEGSDRYYYGVVQTEYPGGGVVGIAGGIPSRTALGWDRPGDAAETVAHELGHNLGRYHAPCGGAGGADPNYPYQQGLIGVYGMDVESGELKVPVEHSDIMGYCDAKFWISDYNYTGIYNFLASAARSSTLPQPSLLVWGRISAGEIRLEPAFQVNARPSLPARPGPYAIQGLDSSGAALFSLSFAPERIPDLAEDQGHFAFAFPLPLERMGRLAKIRVVAATRGGGGATSAKLERRSPSHGAARLSVAASSSGRMVRWNADAYPAAMVRDARTGAIIAFARRGAVTLPAGAASDVELVLSDGVHSSVWRVTGQAGVRVR